MRNWFYKFLLWIKCLLYTYIHTYIHIYIYIYIHFLQSLFTCVSYCLINNVQFYRENLFSYVAPFCHPHWTSPREMFPFVPCEVFTFAISRWLYMHVLVTKDGANKAHNYFPPRRVIQNHWRLESAITCVENYQHYHTSNVWPTLTLPTKAHKTIVSKHFNLNETWQKCLCQCNRNTIWNHSIRITTQLKLSLGTSQFRVKFLPQCTKLGSNLALHNALQDASMGHWVDRVTFSSPPYIPRISNENDSIFAHIWLLGLIIQSIITVIYLSLSILNELNSQYFFGTKTLASINRIFRGPNYKRW